MIVTTMPCDRLYLNSIVNKLKSRDDRCVWFCNVYIQLSSVMVVT